MFSLKEAYVSYKQQCSEYKEYRRNTPYLSSERLDNVIDPLRPTLISAIDRQVSIVPLSKWEARQIISSASNPSPEGITLALQYLEKKRSDNGEKIGAAERDQQTIVQSNVIERLFLYPEGIEGRTRDSSAHLAIEEKRIEEAVDLLRHDNPQLVRQLLVEGLNSAIELSQTYIPALASKETKRNAQQALGILDVLTQLTPEEQLQRTIFEPLRKVLEGKLLSKTEASRRSRESRM